MNGRIYCLALQITALLGYFPPWHPSPSRQSSPRSVKEVEVVSIPYPGDDSEHAPSPEESRAYISGIWNSTEV